MDERRMRVLHVVKGLGLGGTEKVMQLFVQHLDPARFEAAVYSPTDGERRPLLARAGIPVFVGPDLLAVLARFRPHLVHLHRAGWPEPETLRPLKLSRVPAVVETNVFGRHDASPQAGIIDRHLFVSDFCARRFTRTTGIPFELPGYQVLPNPVDTDFLAAHSPRERDFSRPVFGRVSRADPGKWSPLAFEMLPHLVRRLPGARYRVAGMIPEAREFFRARGLADHVEEVPPIPDEEGLAAFLAPLSALAHANDTGESFGLAIAEAMAAGLPVVTHPCPGQRDNAQLDLVEHGATGLHAGTAEEYAGALAWLAENPDQARDMGRRGRDKVARLCRAQDVAARLGDIYRDVLARKGVALS
jgi:glycosyltransferase involved in cell wall biosynthesis